MEAYKIVFVVLHYQNLQVTIDCVEHLKKLDGIENHHIVIVDNASPNHSGIELKEKYSGEPEICCVLSEKNGGFAYGNNLGYQIAKQKFGANIVVVMNSDVNIEDNHFIDSLREYAKTNSDTSIVAPDIITKSGYHQNPYLLKPIPTEEQIKIIIKKMIGRFLYGLPILGSKLIIRKSVVEFQPYYEDKVSYSIEKIVPHGACVIFMPKWTRNEENAFVDGTFLFVEEELLFDYCTRRNHKIQYVPQFTVYHMEDASQNAVSVSAIEKKRMQMKYEIDSRVLLLKHRKKGFGENNADLI